jgi:VanZ family protein
LHQILYMVINNLLSILVGLIITYLSLTNSETFAKIPVYNIPFFDKIVHFCMYFGFMSVIILVNRKILKRTEHLFLAALIPLFYGILMEILQSSLTSTRSGSVYDAISNLAGIFTSLLLWLWIKPLIKERLR